MLTPGFHALDVHPAAALPGRGCRWGRKAIRPRGKAGAVQRRKGVLSEAALGIRCVVTHKSADGKSVGAGSQILLRQPSTSWVWFILVHFLDAAVTKLNAYQTMSRDDQRP